jgi:arylsulfatase A-like enzyme
MIHPLKSPDVYTLLKKNWLWKSVYGSSHGTHHGYDSHVPLVISRLEAKPKTLNFGAYTVDIPASIAEILGLSYPKTIDGRPLPVDFEYR